MFPVGSFVKITDISECKKVELNEVFKVLSSSKSTTVIENKDGINLGGYYSWRFVAADPAANAAKLQVANATEDDWIELDETIYADHILRENIDECKSKIHSWNGWERVSGFRNKKLSVYAKTYNFRCKRSVLPVADATKSQAAEPTKITQQDTKMFKNKFHDGQTITCVDYDNFYQTNKLTVGKKYIVIDSNYAANDGSKFDMVKIQPDNGSPEWFYVYRFSAATAENVAAAEQPKRIVAKVTNNYLTRGQSYEVVGYYIPAAELFRVKLDDKTGFSLCFRSDCFESDISLSDVTNVDGATGTKENEMKKETAIKAASVVGKFAAGWGFRALNYWVFEPAAGIGRPIMKSVRYATFLGGLAAVGYGYYHPQEVKDALVSCLPTVSIEAPAILSGK